MCRYYIIKERLETMRIHTTQNLKQFSYKASANKNDLNKELIRSQFYEENDGFNASSMSTMSFQAKKPKNNKDAKKIIDMAKKGLENIKDKATPEVKKGDKTYKSSFFNALLDLAENGPVFSALTAAVICIFLRPLAIMALPSEFKFLKKKQKPDVEEKNIESNINKNTEISFKGKNKKSSTEKVNNMYAAAQSMSSGVMGLGTAFLLNKPFNDAQKEVLDNMDKYFTPEEIKKIYPWVDESTIGDKNGKLLNKELWKDINGRKFISDAKMSDTLPKFKQLSDVSKETFNNVLNLNIDFESQKGKSFNDVVTKDGRKIYDVIKPDNLGILVKEEGFIDAQILLKDLDKDYLQQMIQDSKGLNEWGNLDINSVYNKDGIVKDFREWKGVDGKSWKLDLDSIFVTSEFETRDKKPRISGKKRFDVVDNEWKFVAFQPNGEKGKLGTEITNSMIKAERENAARLKSMTWTPDLLFRVPIAIATIALIPIVLKNVFHLEKAKPSDVTKKENKQIQKNEIDKNLKEDTAVTFKGKTDKSKNNISFKSKTPNKGAYSKILEFLAKNIEAPLLKSETMKKIANALTKIPGAPTEHMMVLGSAIQSSIYMARTKKDKNLDEDRKETLMLNQLLCFIVPTLIGYCVNGIMREKIKKLGYRYADVIKDRAKELLEKGDEIGAKKANELLEKLPLRTKAVSTLSELASFTLIYRFLSPVVVTPFANAWGEHRLEKKKAKKAQLETA